MNLLAVVQILRTDESDHRIHQQRLVPPRDRVSPRFAGLLIDAVMRVRRQRAALPGLEIHHVRARAAARAPPATPRRASPDSRRTTGSPPPFPRSIETPDRPARRARIASICVVTCASTQICVGISSVSRIRSSMRSSASTVATIVRRRIHADHRVAARVEQSVDHAGRDAARIVGRMIRLQPRREPSRRARSCRGTSSPRESSRRP